RSAAKTPQGSRACRPVVRLDSPRCGTHTRTKLRAVVLPWPRYQAQLGKRAPEECRQKLLLRAGLAAASCRAGVRSGPTRDDEVLRMDAKNSQSARGDGESSSREQLPDEQITGARSPAEADPFFSNPDFIPIALRDGQ